MVRRSLRRKTKATEWPLQAAEDSSVAEPEKRITWLSRHISCPTCGAQRDAARIQLRRPGVACGFRMMWCGSCRTREWASSWTCSCGVKWHLCPVHCEDPDEHCVPKKKLRKALHQDPSGAPASEASAAPVCRVAKLRRLAGSLQSGLDEGPTDQAAKSLHPELRSSEELQQRYSAQLNACPKLAAKIAAWKAAKLSGDMS